MDRVASERGPDVGDRLDQRPPYTPPVPPSPPARVCSTQTQPATVEIRKADPAKDRNLHNLQRQRFVDAVRRPNTTVLLGPNVILDFSDAPPDMLPILFAGCVTVRSVDSFVDEPVFDGSLARLAPGRPPIGGGPVPAGPGRTPHSLGPLLRFGKHAAKDEPVFLTIDCPDNLSQEHVHDPTNDHVIISGVRVEGPTLGQQTDDQFGIVVHRCVDIEISNNEIFGWGGAGLRVVDDDRGQGGPGQEPGSNYPGDRIGRPNQVRILRNYFHHNQHASEDESVNCDFSWDWVGLKWVGCELFRQHAAGYGAEVHHGAWALIDSNLFDMNRHALAAAGDMGGYDARRNLVLKGGGYHGRAFHTYTHQFDIHGTDDNGLGGQAGVQSWFYDNAFQYRNGAAIHIRGRPGLVIYIGNNIFPHEGLEADWGDDAIKLWDHDDLDVIELRPGNEINYDSYGKYGVCDFDGDGVDDLFLATGRTWWFSSYGEFPWSFLAARTEKLEQVKLGYFDNDNKCDVLTESGPEWVISSGGTQWWTNIGTFDTRLKDVAFGQFDPNHRDHRPGVTRRTTHAFRRLSTGQWQITPLAAPAWQTVGGSSYPMSKLRFGDFTGDGVTDVLAISGGRWAISDAARGNWTRLNPYLNDDVSSLFIADLNNNNIDDLLKVKVSVAALQPGSVRLTYKWFISDDGRSRWRELKSYTWTHNGFEPILSGRAIAGRFGAAPGGGVVLTDLDRIGHFYAPLEVAVGASPDWQSLFGY
jgi:hypothetical protein